MSDKVFEVVLSVLMTALFALLLERVKGAMSAELATTTEALRGTLAREVETLKAELTSSAEMRRLVAAKRLETAITIHDKALPFLQWTKGAIFTGTDQGHLRSLTDLVEV